MSYLLAKDTVNGAEGRIIVTTADGTNKVVAGMKNIRTSANLSVDQMRVIGTRLTQSKHKEAEPRGSGNIYYGDDLFRSMVIEYINTGVMPEFTIQITNDDAASSIGTETTAYYGCTLTGEIPLSILDSDQSMLSYEFQFTWRRVAQLERFSPPQTLG